MDGGLMIGLFLGIVFCLIMLWAIINGVKFIINPPVNENRRINILGVIFFTTLLCFVSKVVYTEYNILTNYSWVEGKLITELPGKNGPRYEFEYTFNGKRYTNINSSRNIKGIKFPGGIYKVRVSKPVAGDGRIDFEQEVLR